MIFSTSVMADYYVYICPALGCNYSTIKRHPGSMNCPFCMRKNGDYRYMFGEKIEKEN